VSLAIGVDAEGSNGSGMFELRINRIHGVLGARTGGLEQDHVAALMETASQWPPIVVWGDECLVVDGAHRVAAARRLGHRRIPAVRFVGSADDAFVESVHRNVAHGLPLTVSDRKRAASRVLTSHRNWSDSRIGYVCGLSGKTVARLRRDGSPLELESATEVFHVHRRIGLDGKARPARRDGTQERIRLALLDNPGATLRTIARAVGASPETVRTVRARLATDHTDVTASVATADASLDKSASIARIYDRTVDRPGRAEPSRAEPSRAEPGRADGTSRVTRSDWDGDSALLTCDDGGEFAQWFALHNVDDEWHRFVGVVPVGRIYNVVDEARRRAAAWNSFASLLESRIR
jgi:ParB-like chromosome segregation protein Spo0J